MKSQKIYYVVLMLLLIQNINCEWILNQEDLTQNIFSSSDVNGWTDNRVSSCNSYNTLSMLGGYSKFTSASSTQKTFHNIPPHFRIRISFTLYFIDCVGNTQRNEAVKIKADGKEVFSYSPASLTSNQEFCGSDIYKDSVNTYTAEFDHISQDLVLNFYDTFKQNLSSVTKSWGVRQIQIKYFACHERCASCSGDWSNQCLSCFENEILNNNSECVCQDGYYYSNHSCISLDSSASTCEIQIYQEINNIVVQVSSVLINQQLKITAFLSFAYTKTVIPSSCIQSIQLKMMIRHPLTMEYIDFNDNLKSYVTTNILLSQIVTSIPLSQISSLSQIQNTQGNTVYSVIELAVNLGNSRKFIRVNRFSVYNQIGNSLITFATNIDEQITDGCKATNDDCVIIADLDMDSNICSDSSCESNKTDNSFTVGDEIFIQVKFKYSKFIKFITKSTAYFKGDNVVLNFSNLVKIVSQKEGVTIFSIPLPEPSSNCMLQLTVMIKDEPDDSRLLRSLVEIQNQQTIQQQVLKLNNFSVKAKVSDESNNVNPQSTFSKQLVSAIMLSLILSFIL